LYTPSYRTNAEPLTGLKAVESKLMQTSKKSSRVVGSYVLVRAIGDHTIGLIEHYPPVEEKEEDKSSPLT